MLRALLLNVVVVAGFALNAEQLSGAKYYEPPPGTNCTEGYVLSYQFYNHMFHRDRVCSRTSYLVDYYAPVENDCTKGFVQAGAPKKVRSAQAKLCIRVADENGGRVAMLEYSSAPSADCADGYLRNGAIKKDKTHLCTNRAAFDKADYYYAYPGDPCMKGFAQYGAETSDGEKNCVRLESYYFSKYRTGPTQNCADGFSQEGSRNKADEAYCVRTGTPPQPDESAPAAKK
jgi:hypothetical protein